MKKYFKNTGKITITVLMANLCYSTVTLAASNDTPQKNATATALKISCPKINEIHRSSAGIWNVNNRYGSWKSLNSSFAKKITRFIGSQWQGVGVGSLICTYQTGGEMSFPVQLAYSILVRDPSGLQTTMQAGSNGPTSAWKSASIDNDGQKQNLMNCASSDPSQCEFVPVTRKASVNANQALDNAKKNYKKPFSANL